MKKSLVFLSIVITAASCSAPSEQIRKSFTEVNNSIEESNANKGAQLEFLYRRILQYNGNVHAKDSATMVYGAGEQVSRHIDSLKNIFGDALTEDNTGKVTDVFIAQGEGKKLYYEMEQLYEYCRAIARDKAAIDTVFAWYHTNKNARDWADMTFRDVPAAVAITMLNHCRANCMDITKMVLQQIDAATAIPGRR